VQQPCGDDDEWANVIDTREQQQHLDGAISKDNNGDFLCGTQTMRQQQQLKMSDTQGPLCRLLGQKNRGPPHERDTRIDQQKNALPMGLNNAAWMDLAQRKCVGIHEVHWDNKWMGSLNFDN